MGAFDDYTSPSSGAFSDYPQPKTTPAGQTILQPRSLSQAGQAVLDFGRVMGNALGIGDTLAASQKAVLADITGNANPSNAIPANLAAEKAKTAQASQNIGPAASLVANVAGSAPVAGLTGATTATRLAPYLPGWLAGRVGAAAESALTAGGAAAGRGDPILQSAAMGGAGGAVIGAPGAATGRGTQPYTMTADQFGQTAQNAYRDMGQVGYHPSVVDSAYSQATPTLTKSQLADISPGFRQTIVQQRRINSAGPVTSADSIDGFGRALQNAATTPGDRVLAGRISDNLDGVLDNASTLSGHTPGYASDLQDAANKAIGQRNDLQRLEGWQQKAAVTGGPDVASQARSWLTTDEGQRIAPPNSPLYDATNTLAGTGSKGSYIPWWAKHFILAPVAGVGIGEGLHYLTGDENSPLTRVGEDVGMGLMLMGGQHAYTGATGAMASAAQKRAIDAVRATIGTGNLYSPIKAPNQMADLLRQLYSKATPLIGPRAAAPTNSNPPSNPSDLASGG